MKKITVYEIRVTTSQKQIEPKCSAFTDILPFLKRVHSFETPCKFKGLKIEIFLHERTLSTSSA